MNQYLELYNDVKPLLDKQSCAALNAQREAAIASFKAKGLPTRKDERYRYTDVAQAFEPNYGLSLAPYTIKGVEFVHPMKEAPIDPAPYYNHIADISDPLTALNTALAHDALIIYIPKGTVCKTPVRIENILSGMQDTMVVRRVLIVMEECSEATIFFVDHIKKTKSAPTGATETPEMSDSTALPLFLTSQVIEVYCKDNSHLDLYEIEETTPQSRRFSNLYVETGRNATLTHNNVTLSNGITRNGLDILLRGEGSEVVLNGAVIADGRQHVDNNTLIDHQVARCTSNELYKYVIDDSAIGAFAGKILVREGAQQTSSHETNNNMCASNEARMYTQPMLEIYADDVKCAHGSTVGVMDEAALFYMQQRGIPLEEARTLLKNAFISQVIDEMKWHGLRDRIHILVDKRLSKEERCGTCRICNS
jgi:Fe-S cluster assembly protein SufD